MGTDQSGDKRLRLDRPGPTLGGMLIAIVPVIVMVVGLLMWALAKTNPMLQRVGEWMFVCGLLVTCFVSAKVTLRLG